MTDTVGTKRMRSPSYPSLTLEKAIELADRFYKKETKHKATPEVAIQHLGHTASSGAGIRALAALTSFGLLDAGGLGKERRVWVSELGRAILLDRQEDSVERIKAIQEAALRPSIYKELWSRWGSDFPSEATMKTVLLRDFNFNETSLDQLIRQMKATFEFAKLSEYDATTDELGDSNTEEKGDEETEALLNNTFRKSLDAPGMQVRDITLPLIGGGMAILRTPVPLSEENFDFLMTLLSSMKKALVEKKVDKESVSEGF